MSDEYRHSRCLEKANAPQNVVFACIDGDERTVVREMQDAVRSSVAPEVLADAIGQLRALITRVERCEAVDPDDVRNISRDRDLWELRLDDQAFGVHVRIYVTEIPEFPHLLIALHAHAKFIDGTEEEIAAKQNAAIDEASRRWAAGRHDRWGIP